MIRSTLTMDFTSERIHGALRILHSLTERVKAESGCFGCAVYQNTENKHEIIYEETWRNESDLERHLASEDYKKVLLVMEMARKNPEVRFDTIADSSGVETIKKARISKSES